ncbi:MAG: hypothetical protein J6Y48_07670 [Clostridia bacterium]|nr:hypothetical protein [Clostridia bacterium]
MLTRDRIIQHLKDFAIQKPYVFAMWLEGADGVGAVDEYSDIDFWFDVSKEQQESFLFECISELEKLGPVDSRMDEIRQEIAQSNIHLANTPEYLTLDLCVQSHEIRGREVTCFDPGDRVEQPLVLFDKDNIIRFEERSPVSAAELSAVFDNCRNRILQESRVRKYIKRGLYLEAYAKYLDNIAEPLVTIARLIWLPEHYDYSLCHISSHLPDVVVKELEKLYRVRSLEDIEQNLDYAKELLVRYERQWNDSLRSSRG